MLRPCVTQGPKTSPSSRRQEPDAAVMSTLRIVEDLRWGERNERVEAPQAVFGKRWPIVLLRVEGQSNPITGRRGALRRNRGSREGFGVPTSGPEGEHGCKGVPGGVHSQFPAHPD